MRHVVIALLRTAFFWVIMLRVVEISYRRFGTTHRFLLQGSRNSPPQNKNQFSQYGVYIRNCMEGEKFSVASRSMKSIRFEVYRAAKFHIIIMWQVREFWSVAVSFRNIVLPTYSKWNIGNMSMLKKKRAANSTNGQSPAKIQFRNPENHSVINKWITAKNKGRTNC